MTGDTGATPLVAEDTVPTSPGASMTDDDVEIVSTASATANDASPQPDVVLPPPLRQPPRYHLSLHVETSADERDDVLREVMNPYFVDMPPPPTASSSSSTSLTSPSGSNTPTPWMIASAQGLIRRAVERLEQMLWTGSALHAQMLAQEILRWSRSHPLPGVRHILRDMHESTHVFMSPDFEIRIVLPREEGIWLQGLLRTALRLASENDAMPEMPPKKPDVATFMQRSREPWSRSSARRTRRSRSRSPASRRSDRPTRPRTAYADETHNDSSTRRATSKPGASSCGSHTESSRTLRRLRTPRAKALSANRATWRTIMGLDEGPGTDDSRFLEYPLDESVFYNIQATSDTLTPQERLAWFSGFVRWLFELLQMVLQTMVTGQVPSEVHIDEDDGVMMVQVVQTLSFEGDTHVGALQRTLEKEAGKHGPAVAFLLMLVESRYRGVVPWEYWSGTAQDLQALLTVHADEASYLPRRA